MTLEAISRPRRIAFEQDFNFRDLGGYPAGSTVVQWGKLYRADGMHRIEGADLARVASLGIRTVIDLRTRAEHEERSCVEAELDHVQLLVCRYLDMLDQGASSIVKALTMMSEPERLPIVFHCSAGKDRTGVLAAILLSVLGVADSDIVADDALHRPAVRELARQARAERLDGRAAEALRSPAFLDTAPRAMRCFLDVARSRYGSFAEYLASVGMAPVTIDALRASLLCEERLLRSLV